MQTSTAYSPEHKYDSACPLALDEPGTGALIERAQQSHSTVTLRKQVLEALGAWAWQSSQQTFGYRWKGENTLDWGYLDRWIQIKLAWWLVGAPRTEICLTEYDALRDFIVENSHLRQLDELYSFRNAMNVQRFLRTHPQLITLLSEAHSHLQECFGPEIQIVLQVVSDHESTNWEQLFAYVRTSHPIDEALSRLDRFDQKWFLAQLDQVDGLLNFNLEFV